MSQWDANEVAYTILLQRLAATAPCVAFWFICAAAQVDPGFQPDRGHLSCVATTPWTEEVGRRLESKPKKDGTRKKASQVRGPPAAGTLRFSPSRGRVDRHPVVRRSPRHPWRYDPLPAAMLSALTPVSPYLLHPWSRATQKAMKSKSKSIATALARICHRCNIALCHFYPSCALLT